VTKHRRFEDLPVWRAAAELARNVYALGQRYRLRPSLRDQLERAALSVSNNIAEGFERGTTQELLTFLYIARGSAGEVRSILWVLEALVGAGGVQARDQRSREAESEISDLQSQITGIKSAAESISRQIRGWADQLQNAEIRGQRYLTDAVRSKAKQEKGREEFLRKAEELAQRPRERPT
jgi:four helix bundle protein